jgi:tetratricopeptide (TPR) repeat protein
MEEGSAEWRATTAGLLTLRLFDLWVLEGSGAVLPDGWGVRAIREAIDAVAPGDPVRAILGGIVDVMCASRTTDVRAVAPRLMAYGRALDYAAKWSLAADVFLAVAERVPVTLDGDLVFEANMQLGYCCRVLSDWENATAAYGRAGEIAVQTGDNAKLLRSRLAEAKVAIDHGNLPAAEQTLEEIIQAARFARLPDLQALALHDRASVAYYRKQYDKALHFQYAALELMTDASGRDRLLSDIGVSFLELGMRDAARDAWLILASTSPEQYSRWSAIINLMEVAAWDRAEPVFENYRRTLAQADLPPTLAATFYNVSALGCRLFGRWDAARDALMRMRDVAERHKLNRDIITAESELAALESYQTAPLPSAPMSELNESRDEVLAIASAIGQLRVSLGVAG